MAVPIDATTGTRRHCAVPAPAAAERMTMEQAIGLPGEVRDLAARLGAACGSLVTLRQRGTMRDSPEGRERRFRAVQTIRLQRPEFAWRASAGPFGCIAILDALQGGEARLEVTLLGLLRIAHIGGGAAIAKGEIMRYLAELAWAPDAILCNRALVWTVVDARTLRVGAAAGEAQAEVELRLDDSGRIGHVQAEDRPRKEGRGFVERPWRGRFFDYRQHLGRWLPFAGEVGWVLDGQSFVAWRGELLGWSST
jgi:hypothetical protein